MASSGVGSAIIEPIPLSYQKEGFMFKPHVVSYTPNGNQFCVRKWTIFGWKYLDLYNYKNWHRPSKAERKGKVLGVTWMRCCASRERAVMALTFNQNPPPF